MERSRCIQKMLRTRVSGMAVSWMRRDRKRKQGRCLKVWLEHLVDGIAMFEDEEAWGKVNFRRK